MLSKLSFKVLTFDDYGVSGHPNHIAVSKGLTLLALSLKSKNSQVVAMRLKSKALVRKFLGPFDVVFALLFSQYIVFSLSSVFVAWRGMFAHHSQNKLYRQVFVILSAFSYMNEFEII